MKKFLLTICSFLLVQFAFGQDLIIKINGDEIKAKVLEVALKEIVYQAPDSVDGKSYRLPKSEVFMIHYANGTKDVFQENLTALQDTTKTAFDPEQMYLLGLQDARHHKKGSKYLKPQKNETTDPALAYKQDPNYSRGFEEGTQKRNNKKVAVGLGLIGGLGAFMLLVGSALGGGL